MCNVSESGSVYYYVARVAGHQDSDDPRWTVQISVFEIVFVLNYAEHQVQSSHITAFL